MHFLKAPLKALKDTADNNKQYNNNRRQFSANENKWMNEWMNKYKYVLCQ